MSTCLVKFDPRSVYAEISVLDPPDRSIVFSLLLEMWCHEGHVEHDEQRNARRCGVRPSTFRKRFPALLKSGTFNLVNGRVYPGRRLQRAMRRVGLTPEQRSRVLQEEGACAYCRSTNGPFDIDHIWPASRGGTNHRRNLTLACFACNSAKRDRALHELEGHDD